MKKCFHKRKFDQATSKIETTSVTCFAKPKKFSSCVKIASSGLLCLLQVSRIQADGRTVVFYKEV